MMEWLNNANTIASLIVALFGIGGYIFAVITYLKGKATKSLQEDESLSQTVPIHYVNTNNIVFDRMDWFKAFTKGFWYFAIGEVDDSDYATPIPMGCLFTPAFAAIASAVFALIFFIIFTTFSWQTGDATRGAFIIGLICWLTVLLGIYIQFVGKAIEKISDKKRKQAVQSTRYKKANPYDWDSDTW